MAMAELWRPDSSKDKISGYRIIDTEILSTVIEMLLCPKIYKS